MDVYETCPVFATPRFTLRLIRKEDAGGLLRVYRDREARPRINADNCTSCFCFETLREMEECVNMWMLAYRERWFVRWTILESDKPVGTVEMFRRDDGSDGRGRGVLRIDVHSLYEFSDVFDELLETMLPQLHAFFDCAEILTKAFPSALRRQESLRAQGFTPTEPLIGHDGTVYGDYWTHRV